MMLITKEIERKTPALYSQESKSADEVMVVAKFFDPTGAATWYMTEYDPESRIGFGWVTLGFGPGCDELGQFSITELESLRVGFGLKIERDLHWSPVPLSKIMSWRSSITHD
jgi:hypothetical protein